MAGELWAKYATGGTLYAQLWKATTDQVWNGSAFATYSDGSWSSYAVPMTEKGTSGYYSADVPAGVTGEGVYKYLVYLRTGGSAALVDAPFFVGNGWVTWTGSALVVPSTILDNVSVADPGVVASMTTFPKMMVAVWRRWYKKTKLTRVSAGSGTLETFADDGSTVNSTQTYSEDLTQQTLGAGA